MDAITVFSNLTPGQQIKLTRLSKGLRQVDVASMAKVNLSDVTAIEKDRYLRKTRRERIMRALSLLEDETNGEINQEGH
jgi:transcriptional regulator with XRE-family HTH domain